MVVVGPRHEFSEHSFQHSLIPAPGGFFAFEGRFPSRPPPRPTNYFLSARWRGLTEIAPSMGYTVQ
jgi:hypothetical protein